MLSAAACLGGGGVARPMGAHARRGGASLAPPRMPRAQCAIQR